MLYERTRLTKTSRSRTCVIMTRQVDGSQASRRRCGVAASLRQVDGSQASRRQAVKSTVENGTGRRRGFSNWRRVAVARDARLWSAPEGVARSKMVISGSLSTGPDSCECYESIMYEMSTDTSSSSVSSKPIVSRLALKFLLESLQWHLRLVFHCLRSTVARSATDFLDGVLKGK